MNNSFVSFENRDVIEKMSSVCLVFVSGAVSARWRSVKCTRANERTGPSNQVTVELEKILLLLQIGLLCRTDE